MRFPRYSHLFTPLMMLLPLATALAEEGPGATRRRPIRSGETLTSIARELFGRASCWRDLLRYNPNIRDPNLIIAGPTLFIPAPARSKETPEADGPPPQVVAKAIEKIEPVKAKRSPQKIRALFDKARSASEARRYYESHLAYAELLAGPADFDTQELLEAQHGRGLSRFHQVGCALAFRRA